MIGQVAPIRICIYHSIQDVIRPTFCFFSDFISPFFTGREQLWGLLPCSSNSPLGRSSSSQGDEFRCYIIGFRDGPRCPWWRFFHRPRRWQIIYRLKMSVWLERPIGWAIIGVCAASAYTAEPGIGPSPSSSLGRASACLAGWQATSTPHLDFHWIHDQHTRPYTLFSGPTLYSAGRLLSPGSRAQLVGLLLRRHIVTNSRTIQGVAISHVLPC